MATDEISINFDFHNICRSSCIPGGSKHGLKIIHYVIRIKICILQKHFIFSSSSSCIPSGSKHGLKSFVM